MSSEKIRSFERRMSGWAALAAVACFAALCLPFFAQRVYVADDLGEFHLPVRNFYAQQLASGESFDWMPGLYGGFYIAGEGQLGAYHPWHWLLYRHLPLGSAFNIELLASYPLLFAGTYLFLKRLVLRRDAALLGALFFTFGGFCLLHFVHPNAIAIVAHLPWILLAVDTALTAQGTARRALAELATGLLLASQLLLGYPQYVWFTLLATAALIGWRASMWQAPAPRVLTIGLALVLGGLAGAIQWLPTWHVLDESVRQTASAEFASTGSMHPLNVVQLIAPYLFETRVVGQNTHELGLYCGAVPIVLCVWLLARRREWGRYRPLVRGLMLFTLVALVLAAGEFGGLYRLQSLVPLANRFRFPCRAIVLVQFGVASLAAVAAAMLLESAARADGSHRERDRALWLTFLASVALAIVGPLAWPNYVAPTPWIWAGPLLVGAAAVTVGLTERGVQGAAVAMILLAAADLALYGMSYSIAGKTADLYAYVTSAPLPRGARATRISAPSPKDRPRVGDRMLLAGVSRVDGYAGLEPAKRLDYRQPWAWQLSGAQWAWQETDDVRSWVAVELAAPRARLATDVRTRPFVSQEFRPSLNTVEVERPLSIQPSTPGTARVSSDRPGRIVIETEASAPQLLVTTESFDSGWQVEVDGRESAVVRVDGDFLGCVAPPGNHRVEFEFHPAAKCWGRVLGASGLGLLAFVACIRLAVRPAKRKDETQS